MQISTYKCDLCGAEIKGVRTSVMIANFNEHNVMTSLERFGLDACSKCLDTLGIRLALLPLVENEPVRQEDENPTEEDKKESKPADAEQDPEEKSSSLQKPLKRGGGRRRIDFDLGKATSLWRGGWPISKIAAEMGCASQTVANYLERAHVIKKKVNADAGTD